MTHNPKDDEGVMGKAAEMAAKAQEAWGGGGVTQRKQLIQDDISNSCPDMPKPIGSNQSLSEWESPSCPVCSGTGRDPKTSVTCSSCYGSGKDDTGLPIRTPDTPQTDLLEITSTEEEEEAAIQAIEGEDLYDAFNTMRGNGATDYKAFMQAISSLIAERDKLKARNAEREKKVSFPDLYNFARKMDMVEPSHRNRDFVKRAFYELMPPPSPPAKRRIEDILGDPRIGIGPNGPIYPDTPQSVPATNRLPTKRCDQCDNGIEEAWDYCPWCGSFEGKTEAAMAQTINLVGDKWDTVAGKIIADAELDEMRGSVLANLNDEIASALRNAYADGCDTATSDVREAASRIAALIAERDKLKARNAEREEQRPSMLERKIVTALVALLRMAVPKENDDRPIYSRARVVANELENFLIMPDAKVTLAHLEAERDKLVERVSVLERALKAYVNFDSAGERINGLDDCDREARRVLEGA